MRGTPKYKLLAESLHKKTAFTLVELLVVIAVIGILAALLIPALSQSKKKAQQIQCANNVRQLGIGLQVYTTEKNFYPPTENPVYSNGKFRGVYLWADEIQNELYAHYSIVDKSIVDGVPYPQEGIWHCPSAFRPASFPSGEGYSDYGYNIKGLSPTTGTNSLGLGGQYKMNDNENPNIARFPPATTVSEVIAPSEMMAIGDGFIGNNGIIRDGVFALGPVNTNT